MHLTFVTNSESNVGWAISRILGVYNRSRPVGGWGLVARPTRQVH